MSASVADVGASSPGQGTVSSAKLQEQRKLSRLNAMSTAPIKNIPMTAFMLWMVGNDIHIFSIMFVSMSITQPLNALMATGTAFQMFEDDEKLTGSVRFAKIKYALCCLAALAVGLLKLKWMGLLPTQFADWMDHSPPVVSEISLFAR